MNALAFNRDSFCHLCLQLILFHWPLISSENRAIYLLHETVLMSKGKPGKLQSRMTTEPAAFPIDWFVEEPRPEV
jgi:hypothetical protein